MNKYFVKVWTQLCDKFANVKISKHKSEDMNDKTRMKIAATLQRLVYVTIALFIVLLIIHLM